MVWHCLIEASVLDTDDGTRRIVRASSANIREVCGLGGETWEPCIIAPPTIELPLFNGDFVAAVEPGAAQTVLDLGTLRETYPEAVDADWSRAPITLRVGKVGEPWPWRVIMQGRVTDFGRVANRVSLSLEVDREPLDKVILSRLYTGAGDAEGPVEMKGEIKPLVIGRAQAVEPVLVNAAASIYQFSAYGPIEAIDALYERGADFGPSAGDFPTYAALDEASIAPGRWATCLAEGLIRLGAPQFGVITGDVRGHRVDASTPRTTGAIIVALANIAAVPASAIDTASLSALDADKPFAANIVLRDADTFLAVAQRLVLVCNHQAGISLTGQFYAARVAFGQEDRFTLDAKGRADPQVVAVQEETVGAPHWRMVMGANRAWRVHSASELAFAAEITQAGRFDPAETYREGQTVDLPDLSVWLYINPVASSGNAPPEWPTDENAYWRNIAPPAKASGITHDDGTTVEELKPAQPGADVTGDHTSKDTAAVGGVPSQQLVDQVEAGAADIVVERARIDEAKGEIDALFETYGSTASAAQSAAEVEADRQAVEDARTAVEGDAAASAGSAAVATAKANEAGEEAAAARVDRLAAQTARGGAEAAETRSVGASESSEGFAATAQSASNLAATNSSRAANEFAKTLPSNFSGGKEPFTNQIDGPPDSRPTTLGEVQPGGILRITLVGDFQQFSHKFGLFSTTSMRKINRRYAVRKVSGANDLIVVNAIYGLSADFSQIVYGLTSFASGRVDSNPLPNDGRWIVVEGVMDLSHPSPSCPWAKPSLYFYAANGTAGSVVEIREILLDDVTESRAAETSASIATTAAATATDKAALASQSESLTAQYRQDTLDARGAVQTDAGIVRSDRIIAAEKAAAAQQSAILSANVGSTARNKNPTFAGFETAGVAPPGWSMWGSTGPGLQYPGEALGRMAARVRTNNVNNDAGFQQSVPVTPGYWVLECDASAWDGPNWNRAAVLAQFLNVDGTYLGESYINLAEPLPDGTAPIWDHRFLNSWRKLIPAPPGSASCILYAMGHWSGLGSYGNMGVRTISFHRVAIRPAMQAEIRDQTVLGPLQATVATQSGVLAEHSGKLTAYLQNEVVAGTSRARVSMFARAENGQQASQIDLIADTITLGNLAAPTLTVAQGRAQFDGLLTATAGIRVGATGSWQINYRPLLRSVKDGDLVTFDSVGSIPNVEFSTQGLAPLAAGETYRLSAENPTATSFIARLKIETPAAPAQQSLTNDYASSTGPARQMDRGTAPEASDGSYTFKAVGGLTVQNNPETEHGSGHQGPVVVGPEQQYTAGFAQTVVALWRKKAGVWAKAGERVVWASGQAGYDPVTERSWSIAETVQLGGGVEAFGVTVESTTGGSGYVTDLQEVSWTAQPVGGGVRTASPNGERCQAKVSPQ